MNWSRRWDQYLDQHPRFIFQHTSLKTQVSSDSFSQEGASDHHDDTHTVTNYTLVLFFSLKFADVLAVICWVLFFLFCNEKNRFLPFCLYMWYTFYIKMLVKWKALFLDILLLYCSNFIGCLWRNIIDFSLTSNVILQVRSGEAGVSVCILIPIL